MAGKAIQIQVGGIGIAAGSPFTAGHYALITSGVPPVVADGRLQQLGDAGLSIIAPDVAAPADSTVFVLGAGSRSPVAGANLRRVIIGSVVLGSGNATSVGQILIGANIDAGVVNPNAGGLIVISDTPALATGGVVSHGQSVFIGQNVGSNTGATFDGCVVIGGGATTRSGSAVVIGSLATGETGSTNIGKSAGNTNLSTVAIGSSAKAGTTGVAVGVSAGNSAAATDSVIIGRTANAAGTAGIAIGRDASAAHNSAIAMGRGAVTSFANSWVVGSDGDFITEFNIGGGNNHTGTARTLVLRTTNAQATNNSPGWALTLRAGQSTGTNATAVIAFQTGTVLGSGSTFQTPTTQFTILSSTGAVGQPNTRYDNVTSSPGAALGTLTNAPAAGDPTFWLPVSVGGVRYGLPLWPLP